jgi:hypothetical protein
MAAFYAFSLGSYNFSSLVGMAGGPYSLMFPARASSLDSQAGFREEATA